MTGAGRVYLEHRGVMALELEQIAPADERAEYVDLEHIGRKRANDLMSGGVERGNDLIRSRQNRVELGNRVVVGDEDFHTRETGAELPENACEVLGVLS